MGLNHGGTPFIADGLELYLDPANLKSSKSLTAKFDNYNPDKLVGTAATHPTYVVRTGAALTAYRYQNNNFIVDGGKFISGFATGSASHLPDAVDLVGVSTATKEYTHGRKCAHLISENGSANDVGNVYFKTARKYNYNWKGWVRFENNPAKTVGPYTAGTLNTSYKDEIRNVTTTGVEPGMVARTPGSLIGVDPGGDPYIVTQILSHSNAGNGTIEVDHNLNFGANQTNVDFTFHSTGSDGLTVQWTKTKSIGASGVSGGGLAAGRVQNSDTIHALTVEGMQPNDYTIRNQKLRWYNKNTLKETVNLNAVTPGGINKDNLFVGISSVPEDGGSSYPYSASTDWSETRKMVYLNYNHDAKIMAVSFHNQDFPSSVSEAMVGPTYNSTFYNQNVPGIYEYPFQGYEPGNGGSIGIGKTWLFNFEFDDDYYYMGVGSAQGDTEGKKGNLDIIQFGAVESPRFADLMGSNVNVKLREFVSHSWQNMNTDYPYGPERTHPNFAGEHIGFDNPWQGDIKKYVKINPYVSSGIITIEPKSFTEEIFPRTNDFTYSMWVQMDVVDPKNVFLNFGLVGISTIVMSSSGAGLSKYDFGRLESSSSQKTFNFNDRKQSLDNSALGYLIYYDAESGQLRLDQSPNNTSNFTTVASAPWSPTFQQFYHLSFVRDNNNFKFYVDGNQVGISSDISGTDIHSTVKMISLCSVPTIYSSSSGYPGSLPQFISDVWTEYNPAFYLKGALGKVLKYSRALNDSEILQIYNRDKESMDGVVAPPCWSKGLSTYGYTAFNSNWAVPYYNTNSADLILSTSKGLALKDAALRTTRNAIGIGVTYPTNETSKYNETYMRFEFGIPYALNGTECISNSTRNGSWDAANGVYDPDNFFYDTELNSPTQFRTGLNTSNYNPYDFTPTLTITYQENGVLKEERKFFSGNPDNYKFFAPIKVKIDGTGTLSFGSTIRFGDLPLTMTEPSGFSTDFTDMGYNINLRHTNFENQSASSSATTNIGPNWNWVGIRAATSSINAQCVAFTVGPMEQTNFKGQMFAQTRGSLLAE